MNPIGYLVPASASPTGEAIINRSPLFFQSFQSVWLDEHGCPVGTALPQLSGLSLKPEDCEFGESWKAPFVLLFIYTSPYPWPRIPESGSSIFLRHGGW